MRKLGVLLAAVAMVGVANAAETKVSPEAQAVIGKVATAYSGLKSLEVAGTFTADLDIAGQKTNEELKFSGAYQTPNRFRHEVKDDTTVGSTGERVFAYAKQPNVYFTAAAPKEKGATSELPEVVRRMLEEQNPSVLLAVAKDPEATLKDGVAEITASAPTTVDGRPHDTLLLSMGADRPSLTLLVDRQTHLIRQAQTDLKADVVRRGAPDVKRALLTVNYTTTMPDAPVTDGTFAWAAPDGARESAPMQADAGGGGAKSLEGKAAPDFTLAKLGGGDVKLSDLKGKVVVLDFWATWCGPCVEGLPHVDKVYQENKAKGVEAFAVNMQEEEGDVKKFIADKKLTLPVLMEKKGDVAEKYKVEGIPETVIIGKDGKVRKVFIGSGPDTESQLRKAVEEAVKEGK
jgi:peroxiredoxin